MDASKFQYHLLDIRQLQILADSEDVEAIFVFGYRIRKGIGLPRDEERSWTYIGDAARRGHIVAMGLCMFFGVSPARTRDPREAFRLLHDSATEHPIGSYSHSYTQRRALQTLFARLTVFLAAQSLLAYCYTTGDGVEANVEEGARLFQRSAAHRFSHAQFNLGVCWFVLFLFSLSRSPFTGRTDAAFQAIVGKQSSTTSSLLHRAIAMA